MKTNRFINGKVNELMLNYRKKSRMKMKTPQMQKNKVKK